KSNFIVRMFRGSSSEGIANEIGRYRGQKPIIGREPVMFDVQADGNWTITIEPIQRGGQAAVSGSGDKVSGLLAPPKTGPWEISHDGKSNFIVRLICAEESQGVQNEIGKVSGSRIIRFPAKGPCFWHVQADGNWSLRPR